MPPATAPSFALPAPDARDAPREAPPAIRGAHARALGLCRVAAMAAAATAATLAIGAAVVVFEHDVLGVLARPASISAEVPAGELGELAGLPGPSPLVVAALVPAVALLLLAGVLRRLAADTTLVPRVSPEALRAAERTMGWAVRAIALAAILVFVVPALLQLVGLQVVSLTTGSMAPAHPAGSLLLVVRPADPSAVPVGAVAVFAEPGRLPVTHRVTARVRDEAGATVGYRTRGDALTQADPAVVAPTSVVGVVVGGAPLLGALRAWMASPLGIAIGFVLVWAFGGLAVLFGDDHRRAVAARSFVGAQAVARSTIRPTS